VEHRKKIAEAVNDPDLTISYDLRGGVVTCNVADSIRCIAEIRSDDDRHVPPGVLGAAERLIDAGLFPGMRPRQLVEDVQALWDLGVLPLLYAGKPEKPEINRRERDGIEAGRRARAATDRMLAMVPAKQGRKWRTYMLAYEHLLSYGRLCDTFNTEKAAERTSQDRVVGYERDRITKALRELDELGVLWYWSATGRGASEWAIVALPPLPETAPTDRVQFKEDSRSTAVFEEEASDEPQPLSARPTAVICAEDSRSTGHSVETSVEITVENDGNLSTSSERDSPGDTSTPERDSSPALKETPDDVAGFFDVVREQVGIKLEPTEALVDAIRARIADGYSARHVGGEVDAGSWPADFNKSPEALAMYRLLRLKHNR
jgi:hypothetical protein